MLRRSVLKLPVSSIRVHNGLGCAITAQNRTLRTPLFPMGPQKYRGPISPLHIAPVLRPPDPPGDTLPTHIHAPSHGQTPFAYLLLLCSKKDISPRAAPRSRPILLWHTPWQEDTAREDDSAASQPPANENTHRAQRGSCAPYPRAMVVSLRLNPTPDCSIPPRTSGARERHQTAVFFPWLNYFHNSRGRKPRSFYFRTQKTGASAPGY
jgi:hypothetical protein